MTTVWLLVVLCAMCVYGQVLEVTDFDDFYDGYEFIYHESFELIVMKGADRCYFVYFPVEKETQLINHTSSYHHLAPLKVTENSLLHYVRRNHTGNVMKSSLDVVRDKYHDVLADFQCSDKLIFEMKLDPVPRPTTTASSHTQSPNHNSQPHPGGMGTGMGMGMGMHQGQAMTDFCRHLNDGLHAYPGDRQKFVACTHGMTWVETCTDCTFFSHETHNCVWDYDYFFGSG